jgi:hypothetical protein
MAKCRSSVATMPVARIIRPRGIDPATSQVEHDDEHDEASQTAAKTRTERGYQSQDWSLGNILSWIAFLDPASICQFKNRQRPSFYSLWSRNPKRRPMLVPRPDQILLDALQDGKLTAIRNGTEILSSYWFDKDTRHLSDDLRFRHAEALTARSRPMAALPGRGRRRGKKDQKPRSSRRLRGRCESDTP